MPAQRQNYILHKVKNEEKILCLDLLKDHEIIQWKGHISRLDIKDLLTVFS